MSEATTAEAVSEARPVPEERLLAISADEAFQVRCWWQRLTLPAAELKAFSDAPPWPKGVRATLRRCDTVEAAMLTEGFRLLWHRLSAPEGEGEKQRNYRLQTWACIALVLAEVRAESPGATLGSQLGKQKKETGKPHMSELRFQRLLACRSPEELITHLRRALALIDKRGVSAVYLADNVALWWAERWRESQGWAASRPSQRLSFQWANDYFGTQLQYQHDND
ncbi:type I-E CRISPR-associated protein Cse2/CasB [Billgrantia aerodenitrificans]|uniref:Type I-E CRISPR-associated protein Cse2/CasB n=1 Tax=Billgrantia aerodenitrificans TaxID=2733483 RepID=A0ABS9AYT2_9GAMM|nr:type I-E CRISPR-associated protein Cse2/CasB [Halomonas aerodenitrificans]MCE8026879.1 type I-E CRISPR-associated protein Cse2/CasB [Halomonas aerodenitrificans]